MDETLRIYKEPPKLVYLDTKEQLDWFAYWEEDNKWNEHLFELFVTSDAEEIMKKYLNKHDWTCTQVGEHKLWSCRSPHAVSNTLLTGYDLQKRHEKLKDNDLSD